jgi:hypothetical protein
MNYEHWADRDVTAWLARVNRVVKRLIRDKTHIILLVSGEPNSKQAVELGFALLMGKPLVVAVAHGCEIPDGLRRAADAVVEDVDLLDPAEGRDRINSAIAHMEADTHG